MQHGPQPVKNGFRDIAYLGLIAFVLLLSLPAIGEPPPPPPFGGGGPFEGFETDPGPVQDNNVTAAGGEGFVGGMLVDPSGIGTNEALQGDGLGRREKTDDALARGAEGVGAAIAAGTALTAAGVSLLPFPTTPRGVALIALGALEFAQAGATAGVNGQNNSGRNILTEGTEEGSQSQTQAGPTQEQVRESIREQINTPELQQALAENGVNSDDFVDRLASGELRSFDDIMDAVNSQDEFSAEQIAAGQAEAANFAGGVVGTPEKKQIGEVARIKPDDSQKKPNGKHGESGGGGSGVSGDAVAAAAISNENQAALQEAKDMIRQAEKLADAELAELQRAGLGAGLSRDALVRKYLAKLQKKKKSNPLAKLSRSQLADLGIKRLRRSQRIFELGSRTYLTYGKWRAKAKEKERRQRLRRMQARVATQNGQSSP